jgi:hypothetical protein
VYRNRESLLLFVSGVLLALDFDLDDGGLERVLELLGHVFVGGLECVQVLLSPQLELGDVLAHLHVHSLLAGLSVGSLLFFSLSEVQELFHVYDFFRHLSN